MGVVEESSILSSPTTLSLVFGFSSKAFSLTFHHLYPLEGKALG